MIRLNRLENVALILFIKTIALATSAAFAGTPYRRNLPNTVYRRKASTCWNSVGASLDLQSSHHKETPSDTFHSLGNACETLGIEEFDSYGDFLLDKNCSALRQFEYEVASVFGKEDAVFMPSGVMAQNIALLIHSRREKRDGVAEVEPASFLCHHSSHLLLHEKEAYDALLNMKAIIISTKEKTAENGISVPPLAFGDVEEAVSFLNYNIANTSALPNGAVALILELPHRELGGKLTPFKDIEQMARLCGLCGIKFHCDGARIFEASAGYGLSLSEIARPFDSVYVSSYKGLGAISGALLLGNRSFCQEARIWLRRFGGNLRTLMPYVSSSWSGFRNKLGPELDTSTFTAKQEKIQRIIKGLVSDGSVRKVASFDPQVPETCMVHGYLRCSQEECEKAIHVVESRTGIKVLNRIISIDHSELAAKKGYGCRFELVIGDANFAIHDEAFFLGWRELASVLEEVVTYRTKMEH